MPLDSGKFLLDSKRSESHALVKVHAPSNLRRFANHDSGSVIDHERGGNLGPRVDVDPGSEVGVLGHESRDQRDVEPVQRVGHPVNRNRTESRVGELDLVDTHGGRISLPGGVGIGFELVENLWESESKLPRDHASLLLRQTRRREESVQSVHRGTHFPVESMTCIFALAEVRNQESEHAEGPFVDT